jgi:hypothetical protein
MAQESSDSVRRFRPNRHLPEQARVHCSKENGVNVNDEAT